MNPTDIICTASFKEHSLQGPLGDKTEGSQGVRLVDLIKVLPMHLSPNNLSTDFTEQGNSSPTHLQTFFCQ